MSLRNRLTLAAGGAVMVALLVASLIVYGSVRSKLREQIDASLITEGQNVAGKVSQAAAKGGLGPPTILKGTATTEVIPSIAGALRLAARKVSEARLAPVGKGGVVIPASKRTQAVGDKGTAVLGLLPVDKIDYFVASGAGPAVLRDVSSAGGTLRVYSLRFPGTSDGLIRAYRPLSEANATLQRVELILIALTLGGAVVAALLGRLAAGALLRPVSALASAVEHVKATHDLSERIAVSGSDEVARLGSAFNSMLAELDESLRSQQQLIADASHELRTPLTAHRTNVELLARPDLPPERRGRVLESAVRGIEDLSRLVNDLIQAARNGKSIDQREPVRLDELAAGAVERLRLRLPGLLVETSLEPTTVSGAPRRLERALDNILDNAAKWNASGQTIEVGLAAGVLAVRDHGPGFDEADLPHVFDRFYRAAAARGLPGSGLGLAIVKQAVEDHGGTVIAANAQGGGALVSLHVPVQR